MSGASSRHGSPTRPSTRATGAPRRPRSSRPMRGARAGSAASGGRCPGSSSPPRRRRRRRLPARGLRRQERGGRVLPAGQDGEICVRSPGVMTGYWHSDDTSALEGGWLHTGDIGHVDGDGYLYVVDRKKDLILRGGFNVFPRDIEDVLLSHPAVAQAGVVGRPDARLGEEVVAFVSLRPGAEATAGELTEHARQHL